MPLDSASLLSDLRRLLRRLERDLQEQCKDPTIETGIRAEYDDAKKNQRTAQTFKAWRDEYLTQVAAAWILGSVFVRFLEDNALVDPPMLAGPGERMGFARDSRDAYFTRNPVNSDRDYLEHVFRAAGALPGCGQLFDPSHNPLWKVPISADAARSMVEFWREQNPQTGSLMRDFTDAKWDTRFLGDLYQDLSETARQKYALLQTPRFVEEFILDLTLTPAIQEFGFREVRLIDPACGSGHFLLGAFERLLQWWLQYEPRPQLRGIVQRVLDQIYGVDLNPYAASIARFRMLLVALRAAAVTQLSAAPNFHINVVTGDSLFHGRRLSGEYTRQQEMVINPLGHFYETEDRETLERILGQQYHAVVGNPPYITAKDAALNSIYRWLYHSCHRQFSLVVPFMERFFDLAISGEARRPAGYVGMIVSNAFMKREFGKKLIEQFIPNWGLTAVIDTSGAYIPGHGTPTAMIFARNRKPVLSTVRAVMGIRGEPSTPEEPAKGKVWSEIIRHVDEPGFIGEFVSVADSPRETFDHHPWSLGGGGAAELRNRLEEESDAKLSDVCGEIGFLVITGEDQCFLLDSLSAQRSGLPDVRPIALGEYIRDWGAPTDLVTVWPCDSGGQRLPIEQLGRVLKHFWPYRTNLKGRKAFSTPVEQKGIPWWAIRELYTNRLRTPLCIAFAFVATHNHFVLDRGGKVFNRSAPVIKLPPHATEDDHLALVGLLNSSTACFWMQQVFHNKGGPGGANSKDEKWHDFYEHDGTKLKQFPVAGEKPIELARRIDSLAQQLGQLTPAEIARREVPGRDNLTRRAEYEATRRKMIALQEELDWECYRLYGLVDEPLTMPHFDVPEIDLGERAFEIMMARRMATGELQTKWFARHGSKPISEIPMHWPAAYRTLVEWRIRMIEADPSVALIEKPEYKRRWNAEPWDEQLKRALRSWLLDRLEDRCCWPEVALTSCAELAQRVSADSEFMQVAELYRGHVDFDLTALVIDLVEAEALPYIPALRYKPSGMAKRAQWMRTWELQRCEDEIDAQIEENHAAERMAARDPFGTHLADSSARLHFAPPGATRPRDARAAQDDRQAESARLKREQVGEIAVPPKYKSADFIRSDYWRLRGALDVPKERFILYPGCERRGDGTPVIGWAGWNHLQQAQALAAFYLQARTQEGWSAEKLAPLLAGLADLIPWLLQWHNDLDRDYDLRMGDYYQGFLSEELRALDLPRSELDKWAPGPAASPAAHLAASRLTQSEGAEPAAVKSATEANTENDSGSREFNNDSTADNATLVQRASAEQQITEVIAKPKGQVIDQFAWLKSRTATSDQSDLPESENAGAEARRGSQARRRASTRGRRE